MFALFVHPQKEPRLFAMQLVIKCHKGFSWCFIVLIVLMGEIMDVIVDIC